MNHNATLRGILYSRFCVKIVSTTCLQTRWQSAYCLVVIIFTWKKIKWIMKLSCNTKIRNTEHQLTHLYPWRLGVVGGTAIDASAAMTAHRPVSSAMPTGLSIPWSCPSMIYKIFLCDDHHPLFLVDTEYSLYYNPEWESQNHSVFVTCRIPCSVLLRQCRKPVSSWNWEHIKEWSSLPKRCAVPCVTCECVHWSVNDTYELFQRCALYEVSNLWHSGIRRRTTALQVMQ